MAQIRWTAGSSTASRYALAPGAQHLERIVMADCHAGFGRRIHDITLDLLVDGREQRALVHEVVLQRASAHPGRGHDRLARCSRYPCSAKRSWAAESSRRVTSDRSVCV